MKNLRIELVFKGRSPRVGFLHAETDDELFRLVLSLIGSPFLQIADNVPQRAQIALEELHVVLELLVAAAAATAPSSSLGSDVLDGGGTAEDDET